MGVDVRPVITVGDRRRFLRFPWRVYRRDPLWVPPLLPARGRVIDPARGPFFQRGEAALFMAWQDDQPVGTICVAEDPLKNQLLDRQDTLFGFFEYVEDYEVFTSLLEHGCNWARERGLTDLFGPFNLDYEDSYGVLIAGRDRPPTLMCSHTPPYYRDFMESYGFEPARPENVALAIDLQDHRLERLVKVGRRVLQEGAVTVRSADFAQFEREVARAHQVLNAALVDSANPWPWLRDNLEAIFKNLRALADPDLILFAEVASETVGFLPGLPNFNEVFTHANGLRHPWDYLRLRRGLRTRPDCLAIKAVAVLPNYWWRGVAVALLSEMTERARAKGYLWVDLSITSVDNPHTIPLAQRLGAEIYKRWQVYRRPI